MSFATVRRADGKRGRTALRMYPTSLREGPGVFYDPGRKVLHGEKVMIDELKKDEHGEAFAFICVCKRENPDGSEIEGWLKLKNLIRNPTKRGQALNRKVVVSVAISQMDLDKLAAERAKDPAFQSGGSCCDSSSSSEGETETIAVAAPVAPAPISEVDNLVFASKNNTSGTGNVAKMTWKRQELVNTFAKVARKHEYAASCEAKKSLNTIQQNLESVLKAQYVDQVAQVTPRGTGPREKIKILRRKRRTSNTGKHTSLKLKPNDPLVGQVPDYSAIFGSSISTAQKALHRGKALPSTGVICESSRGTAQEGKKVYYFLSTGASVMAPIEKKTTAATKSKEGFFRSLSSMSSSPEQTHLADRFLVCGINRAKFVDTLNSTGTDGVRVYEPKLLKEVAVDTSKPLDKQCPHMVFPCGIKLHPHTTDDDGAPESADSYCRRVEYLNKLNPQGNSMLDLNRPGSLHSFVLTDETAEYRYCTCLMLRHTFTPTVEEVLADATLTTALFLKLEDENHSRTLSILHRLHCLQLGALPDETLDNIILGYVSKSPDKSLKGKFDAKKYAELKTAVVAATGFAATLKQNNFRCVAPLALAFVSRFPLLDLTASALEQLHHVMLTTAAKKSKNALIEDCIKRFMCEVPLPARPVQYRPPVSMVRKKNKGKPEVETVTPMGVHISFALWPSLQQSEALTLQRSPVQTLPTLNFSLAPLFEMLDCGSVATLVGSILTGRRVLFISKELGHLTIATECVFALIFPLQWRAAYCPMLTRDVVNEFLLRTTPYVAGVHPALLPREFLHPSLHFDHDSMNTYTVEYEKKDEVMEMLNNEVVLVFLDSEASQTRVKLPRLCPRVMLPRPMQIELLKSLNTHCPSSGMPVSAKGRAKMGHSFQSAGVRVAFLKMMAEILRNVPACTIYREDGTPEFDREAFETGQPEYGISTFFFKHFVQTEMFDSYIKRRLSFLVRGESITSRQILPWESHRRAEIQSPKTKVPLRREPKKALGKNVIGDATNGSVVQWLDEPDVGIKKDLTLVKVACLHPLEPKGLLPPARKNSEGSLSDWVVGYLPKNYLKKLVVQQFNRTAAEENMLLFDQLLDPEVEITEDLVCSVYRLLDVPFENTVTNIASPPPQTPQKPTDDAYDFPLVEQSRFNTAGMTNRAHYVADLKSPYFPEINDTDVNNAMLPTLSQMRLNHLLKTKKVRQRTVIDYFIGKEAVAWMVEIGKSASPGEAVKIFQSMLDKGQIHPVERKGKLFQRLGEVSYQFPEVFDAFGTYFRPNARYDLIDHRMTVTGPDMMEVEVQSVWGRKREVYRDRSMMDKRLRSIRLSRRMSVHAEKTGLALVKALVSSGIFGNSKKAVNEFIRLALCQTSWSTKQKLKYIKDHVSARFGVGAWQKTSKTIEAAVRRALGVPSTKTGRKGANKKAGRNTCFMFQEVLNPDKSISASDANTFVRISNDRIEFKVRFQLRGLPKNGTATLRLKQQSFVLIGLPGVARSKNIVIQTGPFLQVVANKYNVCELLIGCQSGFKALPNEKQISMRFSLPSIRERFAGRLRAMCLGLHRPETFPGHGLEGGKKLKIFCTTFNAAAKSWSHFVGGGESGVASPIKNKGNSLSDWIPNEPHDIYCFALQESKRLKEWIKELHAHLNRMSVVDKNEYLIVNENSLGQIHLVVFMKDTVAYRTSDFVMHKVATGKEFGGIKLPNKGGLACGFTFDSSTKICFVACHFNARAERLAKRAKDFQAVFAEMELEMQTQITHHFHHVFWMGDLNYRESLPDTHFDMNTKDEFECVQRMVDEQDWEGLSMYDQLNNEIKRNTVFSGFVEAPINFAPTYRMVKGKRLTYGVKSETRWQAPSYTDRILSHSVPGMKDHLTCVDYMAAHEFLKSDHRAVRANFTLQTLPPYVNLQPSSSVLTPAVHIVFNNLHFTNEGFENAKQNKKLGKKKGLQFSAYFYHEYLEVNGQKSTDVSKQDDGWHWDKTPILVPSVRDPEFLSHRHITVAICAKDRNKTLIGSASMSLRKAYTDPPYEFDTVATLDGIPSGRLTGKLILDPPMLQAKSPDKHRIMSVRINTRVLSEQIARVNSQLNLRMKKTQSALPSPAEDVEEADEANEAEAEAEAEVVPEKTSAPPERPEIPDRRSSTDTPNRPRATSVTRRRKSVTFGFSLPKKLLQAELLAKSTAFKRGLTKEKSRRKKRVGGNLRTQKNSKAQGKDEVSDFPAIGDDDNAASEPPTPPAKEPKKLARFLSSKLSANRIFALNNGGSGYAATPPAPATPPPPTPAAPSPPPTPTSSTSSLPEIPDLPPEVPKKGVISFPDPHPEDRPPKIPELPADEGGNRKKSLPPPPTPKRGCSLPTKSLLPPTPKRVGSLPAPASTLDLPPTPPPTPDTAPQDSLGPPPTPVTPGPQDSLAPPPTPTGTPDPPRDSLAPPPTPDTTPAPPPTPDTTSAPPRYSTPNTTPNPPRYSTPNTTPPRYSTPNTATPAPPRDSLIPPPTPDTAPRESLTPPPTPETPAGAGAAAAASPPSIAFESTPVGAAAAAAAASPNKTPTMSAPADGFHPGDLIKSVSKKGRRAGQEGRLVRMLDPNKKRWEVRWAKRGRGSVTSMRAPSYPESKIMRIEAASADTELLPGDEVISVAKSGKRAGQTGTLISKIDAASPDMVKWVLTWANAKATDKKKPYKQKNLRLIDRNA